MEINVCLCHSSSALCVCGNSAFSVIERGREERERERGRERDRCQPWMYNKNSRDRVVSIWLASCANGHKELFVPQQAGGESSPVRLRDSGELKQWFSNGGMWTPRGTLEYCRCYVRFILC